MTIGTSSPIGGAGGPGSGGGPNVDDGPATGVVTAAAAVVGVAVDDALGVDTTAATVVLVVGSGVTASDGSDSSPHAPSTINRQHGVSRVRARRTASVRLRDELPRSVGELPITHPVLGVAWPAVGDGDRKSAAICVGRQSLIRSEPQRPNADKVQIARQSSSSIATDLRDVETSRIWQAWDEWSESDPPQSPGFSAHSDIRRRRVDPLKNQHSDRG